MTEEEKARVHQRMLELFRLAQEVSLPLKPDVLRALLEAPVR